MLLQPVAKIVKTPWTNSAFITIWLPRRNLVQKNKKDALIGAISTSCFAGMSSSGGGKMISQARHLKCLTLQLPRSH